MQTQMTPKSRACAVDAIEPRAQRARPQFGHDPANSVRGRPARRQLAGVGTSMTGSRWKWLGLVLACGVAGVQADTTLVMFRHGEKPALGLGQLSCQGLNRALALPDVLVSQFGTPQ